MSVRSNNSAVSDPFYVILLLCVFVGLAALVYRALVRRQRFPAAFLGLWILWLVFFYLSPAFAAILLLWTIAGLGYAGWTGVTILAKGIKNWWNSL